MRPRAKIALPDSGAEAPLPLARIIRLCICEGRIAVNGISCLRLSLVYEAGIEQNRS